jgi:signal transduction histidine kinase
MSDERRSLLLAREFAAATSDTRAATVITGICDELETLLDLRATIGFDLHDGPLQSLAAVRLDLELFRSQIASAVDDASGDLPLLGRIADIGARLSALEAELRDVAVASADDRTTPSLTVLIAELAGQTGANVRVELRLDPAVDRIPIVESRRLALARVVSAAVANAAQHSGAALVVVTARRHSDVLEIQVADTGAGFDVAAADARARRTGRLGLAGMKQRMTRLGGELRVESVPGSGTSIHARLPLR